MNIISDIGIQAEGTTVSTDNPALAKLILDFLSSEEGPAAVQPGDVVTTPQVGAHWPEQGGAYAGVHLDADSGDRFHIIVATEDLKGEYSWNGAVKAACDFQGAGQDDWELPSRFVLAQVYANLRHLFEEDWYWSSTQFSANGAWFVNFSNGTQSYSSSKFSSVRVRPVRRLKI